MKKMIALILVVAAIWAIDQKPWRKDEPVPYYNNTNHGYINYDDGGYDDYWEDDNDETFIMECTWCRGSGVCKDCDGDGKSRLKGVLATFGCALCDSTGDCYKCKGTGYTVHH